MSSKAYYISELALVFQLGLEWNLGISKIIREYNISRFGRFRKKFAITAASKGKDSTLN